jgi:hypothetical protein
VILIFILVLILIITFGVIINLFYKLNITGLVVEKNENTYTTAICNETNFCQDYIVTCKGDEVINTSPITGAFVQHEKNWKDPRENFNKELCK